MSTRCPSRSRPRRRRSPPTSRQATPGQIDIVDAQHTVTTVEPTLGDRWIYKDVTANALPSVQYFQVTTPLDALPADRCGKMVFSDIHVSSGDFTGLPFPTGCSTTTLSPQEMVLAFMLFDIASCVDDID